jgi:hypothetical protein
MPAREEIQRALHTEVTELTDAVEFVLASHDLEPRFGFDRHFGAAGRARLQLLSQW